MSNQLKNIQGASQEQLLLQKLKNAQNNIKNSKQNVKSAKNAANQFEALFVQQLLKEMRKTIMKSGLLSEGVGQEIMTDLFDEKIAESIAQNSNLGLAEIIEKQMNNQNIEPSLNKLINPKSHSSQKNKNNHLIKKLNPFINDIQKAAKLTKVNPILIKAVILTESAGNPQAVSSKGAKGLMQLMDTTAKEMGVKNSFNPYNNILGGSLYLKKMLNMFNGNLNLALAAYNAGPSAVKKYGKIPPYKETQNYVTKIKSYVKSLAENK